MTTPTRLLADKLVKGGIDAFITERRAASLSFHRIALDLHAATKGQVSVTGQTVANWHRTP